MYNIYSPQEMSKMIRQNFNKKVSPEAIHALAKKLRYTKKTIGGKRGYSKSLYTDLQRHWGELLAYDQAKAAKTRQKPLKPNNGGGISHYTYNGEPDRKDYDWEVDESVITRAVNEAISSLLSEAKEHRALQINIFGEVEDLTDKNKAEAKKKKQARIRRERATEKKKEKEAESRRLEYERDSQRMVGGGLFGDDKDEKQD